MNVPIASPSHSEFESLCDELAQIRCGEGAWPAEHLRAYAAAGVFSWFVPRAYGGLEWSAGDLLRGYVGLARSNLTAAFVLTQWASACRRLAIAAYDELKPELLPALARGNHFTTIAISHLTTSRRHLGRPAMLVSESAAGLVFDGFSPWVTGATHAQTIVLGGELADGRQVLVALPTQLSGVEVLPPAELVALSGSHTGEVCCRQVVVPPRYLLHGPVRNVMAMGQGAGTGGLQTTALAVGLTLAALDFLAAEAGRRENLRFAGAELAAEADTLHANLLAAGDGTESFTPDELRVRANSLVLRATQAALVAAKGAGFAAGHPVGRWCREALFFLVWSCPQGVWEANLCELAGLE